MNIEHGIPIPKRKGGEINIALNQMNIGDSVVLPIGKDMSWRNVARQLGIKVTVRRISNNECRLWRTAQRSAQN